MPSVGRHLYYWVKENHQLCGGYDLSGIPYPRISKCPKG